MTQDAENGRGRRGPRCIALVGPFQSGKTTLLEAILARMGGLQRQGTVAAGTTIGDASAEARAHGMSVEANVATVDFMGDAYTFVDCPGSVEFLAEMRSRAAGRRCRRRRLRGGREEGPGAAAHPARTRGADIPRFLFLNKIDTAPPARARRPADAAAGLARAAADAPDPDLEGRHRGRLYRSRSRAGLHLPRARASRDRRDPAGRARCARRRRATPCWSGFPT